MLTQRRAVAAPSDKGVSPIFRPIHYLGSKLRIVEAITAAVDSVAPIHSPVCDLFAGSGTVSLALSQSRPTTAVDIQEYSRVLCSALLTPPTLHTNDLGRLFHQARASKHSELLSWAVAPLVAHEARCLEQARGGKLEALCDLIDHGSPLAFQQGMSGARNPGLRKALSEFINRLAKAKLSNHPGVLTTRYFGGIYFSYAQAAALDSILEAVHKSPPVNRTSLLAAALSSASDIVNTVGRQFAQPIRPRASDGTPKKHLISKCCADRGLDVFAAYEKWFARYQTLRPTGFRHEVIRTDFAEALTEDRLRKVKVVYADPPYTRDHYSRYYHVLETICLRDNPDVSTVSTSEGKVRSRGIYRMERHQSPFCIKSKAPAAFEALFAGVRRLNASLIVSYSPFEEESDARPRLMTIDRLHKFARQSFRRVEVESVAGIAHSKLNTIELNTGISQNAEVLLLCKP